MAIRGDTFLGLLLVVLVLSLLTDVHAGYERSCSAEDYSLFSLSFDCQNDFLSDFMEVCSDEARQKRSPFTSYSAAHRFLRKKRSEAESGIWCECCIHPCTSAELAAHC
ncbi:uncharacterized protein [Watersipora subatra]|uniref:uncharacterized protein n=1 Tax=Watersipora subatra TaxID=2589382 RepID=UPI00355B016D